MKPQLYIKDTAFQHAKTSSWYNESKKFDWVREYDKTSLVFTDNNIFDVDYFSNEKKYAWLLEPPAINPQTYEYIKTNYNKFDFIFTCDEELLKLSDKFVLIPFGGCWISEDDRKLYNKTKLVSCIMSSKKTTDGHLLRHQVKEIFKNIDYFGDSNPIAQKITGLSDYAFSLVIENSKRDFYFTEKIIDCFMVGTIPIYWGCPSIKNFFDINGILTFDTIEELFQIVNTLSFDLYNEKIKSVQNNFKEAQKYLIADDLIFNFLHNH